MAKYVVLIAFLLLSFSAAGFSQYPVECLCPAGIGASEEDKPFLSIESDEGSLKLILCGYVKEEIGSHTFIASEFELIPCGLGKPLLQFKALQECRVEINGNTLQITEFKRLPYGKDWKWVEVNYFQYTITLLEPDKIIVNRAFVFTPPALTKLQIQEALSEYEKQKKQHAYSEAFPFMMLAAALNGDEAATNKFLVMREDLGLDGHMAEMYSQAMEIYRAFNSRHIEEGKGAYAEEVDYHKEYSLEELKELFE